MTDTPRSEALTPEEEATFRDLVAHPAGDGQTALYQVRRLLATLDAAREAGTAWPTPTVRAAIERDSGADPLRAYIHALTEQGVLTEEQAEELRWLADDDVERVLTFQAERAAARPPTPVEGDDDFDALAIDYRRQPAADTSGLRAALAALDGVPGEVGSFEGGDPFETHFVPREAVRDALRAALSGATPEATAPGPERLTTLVDEALTEYPPDLGAYHPTGWSNAMGRNVAPKYIAEYIARRLTEQQGSGS